MDILVVSATSKEIDPLLEHLGADFLSPGESWTGTHGKHNLKVLVTGLGLMATAYHAGLELNQNKYDLAVNLGLAGSFDHSIPLGEVVMVTQDRITDLGAEDHESFLDATELSLASENELSFSPAEALPADLTSGLRRCSGISVNTVHGKQESIQAIIQKRNPQTESMEGASFFMVCQNTNTPCLQLRAISNYVEPRNKENWVIGTAVQNLTQNFISIYKQLALAHS